MSSMCGIACIISNHPDREKRLQQSLQKILHRGTSHYEYKILPGIVLGANRLAIQSSTHEQQPATNTSKTIFAVHNGEIFNYKKLKKELENKGYTFTCHDDTTLLTYLYEAYGTHMVQKIDSDMFAFVIYDKKNNHVFAARDPLGVKPLYYGYHSDGSLHFASEMKQLSQFADITTIYWFPPGHYYYQGTFTAYKTFAISNTTLSLDQAEKQLTTLLTNAVNKRIQTPLPIGVFLSGGVDSSLVMEIAQRGHKDVTALIVGEEGDSDYDHAITLCKQRQYKYASIPGRIPSIKDIQQIIYHTESYEPLINRIAIANDLASKLAKQLGIRVVLCGEGADELFGGYNEFLALKEEMINQGCLLLTQGLEQGHLMRVDRLSMKHTIEVRNPFLDTAIVDFALSLPGSYKIQTHNHSMTTKHILRSIAQQFLPDYICDRYKVPFHTGAGIDVGYNFQKDKWNEAQFSKEMQKQKKETENETQNKNETKKEQEQNKSKSKNNYTHNHTPLTDKEIQQHQLTTIEEKRNYTIYKQYGYHKLHHPNPSQRILIKDTIKTLNQGDITHFLIAGRDYSLLYFPLYYAQSQGWFAAYNISVKYMATGSNQKAYESVCNNCADISIGDLLYHYINDQSKQKPRIISQWMTQLPLKAVTYNPEYITQTKDDFSGYILGSYESDTMAYAFTQLLPHKQVMSLENTKQKTVGETTKTTQDVLFSSIYASQFLSKQQQKRLPQLLDILQKSINHIKDNPQQAIQIAQQLFPDHRMVQKTLQAYQDKRGPLQPVQEQQAVASYTLWSDASNNTHHQKIDSRIYDNKQALLTKKIRSILSKKFLREEPKYFHQLVEYMHDCINTGTPIRLIGFRGVGAKNQTDKHDHHTMQHLTALCDNLQKTLGISIDVIFIISDAHAEANGYQQTTNYIHNVKHLIKTYRHQYTMLSSLLQTNYKDIKNTQVIQNIAIPSTDERNAVPIKNKLITQARKHYQYHDAEQGAKQYFALRTLEKEIIIDTYGTDFIFFAHTSSDMEILYPDVPTLFLWSEKRGKADAPWFC